MTKNNQNRKEEIGYNYIPRSNHAISKLGIPNCAVTVQEISNFDYVQFRLIEVGHTHRSLLGWTIVAIGAVEGLRHGEQQQEHSSDDGDDRPRVHL